MFFSDLRNINCSSLRYIVALSDSLYVMKIRYCVPLSIRNLCYLLNCYQFNISSNIHLLITSWRCQNSELKRDTSHVLSSDNNTAISATDNKNLHSWSCFSDEQGRRRKCKLYSYYEKEYI